MLSHRLARPRTVQALTLLAAVGLAASAGAQVPVRLEINPYSVPAADSSPTGFARIQTPSGERVVFSANDGSAGTELWITDGTPGGTQLLKDINAGTTGSTPQNLTSFGSRVVFTADDGSVGRELWITDGTAAGTVLLKDVRAASTTSPAFSSAFGVVGAFGTPGSFIAFGANDGVNGSEPWVTDGTPDGTIPLGNLAAGTSSSNASGFFSSGTAVYFLANDQGSFGNELWSTQGTPASTTRLTDYAAGSASSGISLDATLNGFGFGPGTLATTGQEPVAVNLADGSVIPLGDLRAGIPGSTPQEFVVAGSAVYFRATTLASENQLYRVDFTAGVPTGATLVAEINPSGNDNVGNLAAFNGFVYFAATDGTGGRELWRSNGTTTELVADINTGPGDSTPLSLFVAGGRLFFSAITPQSGRELYVHDGTSTTLVADLRASAADALAATPSFIELGGRLLFPAKGTTIGTELFSTDGSSPTLVADIRPQTGSAASAPSALVASGSRLYFSALDEAGGRELWTSDGSQAGTVRVIDATPGTGSSSPYGITAFTGGALFAANGGTGTGGTGIEFYQATGASAALLRDINPGTGSSAPGAIANIGVLDGVAYFQANDGSTGAELWRYDGVNQPALAADINPNAGGGSTPGNFASLGGSLYFSAGFTTAGGSGIELYRFDGTTASLVEDFNTGTASSLPAGLFPFDGRLFMRATPSSTFGSELVAFDPATSDVYLVQDIRPGSGSSTPSNFVAFENALHFTATDANANIQLYTATAATNSVSLLSGTQSSPNVGAVIGSSVTTLVSSGGYLFFAGGNNIGTNVELWAYKPDVNGGFAFPIEINSTGGSFPTDLADVNGRLYFAAVGATGGNELYRVTFDGSGIPSGAELVADLNPSGSSSPRNFRVVGSRLYFAADDGVNGEELWYLDTAASSLVCCRGVTCSVVAAAGDCTAPAGVGVRVLGASATTCTGQAALNDGCCYADFNKSGVKDVADIFAYLSAWFANSPFAEVGGDGTGTRDVADIFSFLSAWFAGCN